MGDDPKQQAPPEGGGEKRAQAEPVLADFAEALGGALINIDLYGMQHRLAVDALEDCFPKLTQALAQAKRIDMAVAEDNTLFLNGQPTSGRNPRILALVRRLKAVHISGFALKHGLDAHEFIRLVTYLSRPLTAPETAVGLVDSALPHISATRQVIVNVSEGEEAPTGAAAGAEGGQGESPAGVNVSQILAFLKGEATADEPQARSELARTATDADQLAKLILEATAVRQATQDAAAGESLGDMIVGCLRRTFDTLNDDPAFKAQKGKRELKRTLAVLEQKVLEKLRQYAADGYAAAAPRVSEEIESQQEELEIDSLVAQYVKSRRSSADRESKLLRFMHRKGGAEEAEAAGLKAKLEAEGLDEDGWRQLTVKSELSAAPAETGPAGPSAVASLPLLLAELVRIVGEDRPEQELTAALDNVGRGVQEAVTRTAAKVDDLAALRDGRSPRAPGTPQNYRALLREIIQELCQPLTVITATIEMLSKHKLGELNNPQRQALSLAAESGMRLSRLIDELIAVSGVPTGLHPDADRTQRIYGDDDTIIR